MYCPTCGKENNDSAQFCKDCGKQILRTKDSLSGGQANTNSDFIWGYRFKVHQDYDLPSIQAAIEKKGDYRLDRKFVKEGTFIYENSSNSSRGIILITQRKDEIFVVGNKKGLISVRSRYINQKFENPIKEKIFYTELDKSFLDSITTYSILQGAATDNPVGISGWLGWFIFGIFLSSIVDIVISLSDFSSWYILDLAFDIFGLFVGYSLIKMKPRAVKHTKIFLLSLAIYDVLILILLSLISQDSTTSDGISMTFRSIVYALVWLWYFSVSKRVKATYGN